MDAPRRCECSDVARMAYGACASDGRSADAWTERAPILRGREGVLTVLDRIGIPIVVSRIGHSDAAPPPMPDGQSNALRFFI